ncbi:hypothetical protein P4679_23610 [Priestia megaterium]|uniref:hypothetical protein n=1 Tax=Priestia megaterium TaxID=1404 RepID=UPI002E214D04|nr:hypothetical protein [Priestia megaterium]
MKIEGEVFRVYNEKINDITFITVLLVGQKTAFTISTADFYDARFTEIGDKLILKYKDTGEDSFTVSDYSNINLNSNVKK